MSSPPPDWFRGAFEAAYLTVYAHRDDGAASEEAAFVAQVVGMGPGDRVLDAGCGAGRHCRALAGTGASMVGLDLSAGLLAAARRASATGTEEGGPAPRYVRGDLRRLPFGTGSFHHVVSLFTSFGYFDEQGDRAHARGLRRVLRPGGRLLLDFLNVPAVEAGLVPSSRKVVDGRLVLEHRRIEGAGAFRRVRKDVEVHGGDTDDSPVAATWTESVRLYDRDQVAAMLEEAGLAHRTWFGDLTGNPWTPESPRLVALAEARP